MFINRRWCGVLCAGLLCAAFASHAATQLNRTRVVVRQADGKAQIDVRSKDKVALLLQAWVDRDDGSDADAPPALPWIVDPPVARLDPGQTRSLNVMFTGAADELPADRESLFWLNVLEVPLAVDSAASPHARLAIAVQSRVKLFYRPQALADASAAPVGEHGRLRFTLARAAQHLDIDNPAAIHQTLVDVRVARADAAPVVLEDAPMLAPFTTRRLALPAGIGDMAAPWRVDFSTLDDDGNVLENTQAL